MELGKRPFAEVVLDPRRYQVSVQTLEPEQRQELQRHVSESSCEILAIATQFYQHAPSISRAATQYLQSSRQLRRKQSSSFNWATLQLAGKLSTATLVEQKTLLSPTGRTRVNSTASTGTATDYPRSPDHSHPRHAGAGDWLCGRSL